MNTTTDTPDVEVAVPQAVSGRPAKTLRLVPSGAPAIASGRGLAALFLVCSALIGALLATHVFLPAADTVTSPPSGQDFQPAP